MKKIVTIISILFSLGACNDSAFLREEPEDFLTIDNAFLNYEQFKTGINQMYAQVRVSSRSYAPFIQRGMAFCVQEIFIYKSRAFFIGVFGRMEQ